MKIGNKSIQRLQQFLVKENLDGEIDKYIFDEEFDKIHLHAEIADFDKFSYQIRNLELKNIEKSPDYRLTADELKKRAEILVSTVTYLLENLALVEIDTVNSRVQIRSVSTHKGIDNMPYFEIIIDSQKSVYFGRFQQKDEQKQRSQIAFKITEEVLERLIDDLAELIS
ncbi:MAG: hypothetical protein ACE5JB_07160 [bacterium]